MDKYDYIGIETLLNFCENSKDHTVSPNDFMRMNRIKVPEPSEDKYEYHYDHTDCIWYRPEARNRCPVTCAQYRDQGRMERCYELYFQRWQRIQTIQEEQAV